MMTIQEIHRQIRIKANFNNDKIKGEDHCQAMLIDVIQRPQVVLDKTCRLDHQNK